MRLVSLFAFAAAAVLTVLADPLPPPDISGKLMLRYQPIVCVKAPCPAGTYGIEQDGKRIATVAHLKVDPATDDGLKQVIGQNLLSDALAIDGDVWIEGKTSTAVLLARRAMAGEWKPATPAVATPPSAATDRTIVLVNKTGDVIRGVYLAPAAADNWGRDLMGDNIQAGERRTIAVPTADCLYDIRILLASRPTEEIRQQDVCTSGTVIADGTGTLIERGAP